jgi:hypothetical protein
MSDESALDLRGPEPVAGDVDHVIDPAGDPVVAVGVAARAVAGGVEAREAREVGLHETLVIAEHGPDHRRSTVDQAEVALGGAGQHVPVVVDDGGLDPEERQGCRAGLERGRAGQRRDHDAAGLRLPPCVDDRAATLPDNLVIPDPSLGIDRLAD